MFNDDESSWEAFPEGDTGEPRNKGGSRGSGAKAVPDADRPWDDARLQNNDRYKGLTPPISPAQVRGIKSLGLAAHREQL